MDMEVLCRTVCHEPLHCSPVDIGMCNAVSSLTGSLECAAVNIKLLRYSLGVFVMPRMITRRQDDVQRQNPVRRSAGFTHLILYSLRQQ